jgi:hypothetical protein
MGPNQTTVDKNTELFVVDNSLIDRVVCAENEMLNVIDNEGQPVIAASYCQKEFPPTNNVSWGFVTAQKRDFVDGHLESDEE